MLALLGETPARSAMEATRSPFSRAGPFSRP